MARLRTFIAVDMGKAIRDRMVALQGTLARTGTEVKWVEPENLHVTLLFLGEVDDRVVPSVCKAVAESLQDLVAFPMSIERGTSQRERSTFSSRQLSSSDCQARLSLLRGLLSPIIMKWSGRIT